MARQCKAVRSSDKAVRTAQPSVEFLKRQSCPSALYEYTVQPFVATHSEQHASADATAMKHAQK